jgi:serine/threonine protein kinase
MRCSLYDTVREIKEILGNDKHENVVRMYDHSWQSMQYFKIDVDVYYIKMECYDLTLEHYIKYHQGQRDLPIAIETGELYNLVISKNCSALSRAANTWTIGCHIALRLEHMHAKGIVHKALKPSHGTLILNVERLT